MNYLIMMNGFTATGKSTIAKKLSEYLKDTNIYHSAIVRKKMGLTPAKLGYEFNLENPVFVKRVSPLVYKELTRRAKESLRKGRNVILDASYSFFWQREQVYLMTQVLNADIYILQCVCNNKEEIIRRLSVRKENPKNPLNEALVWRTYISTVKHAEPIEGDRMPDGRKPKIIQYDTYRRTVKTFNIDKDDEVANKVISYLKSIK